MRVFLAYALLELVIYSSRRLSLIVHSICRLRWTWLKWLASWRLLLGEGTVDWEVRLYLMIGGGLVRWLPSDRFSLSNLFFLAILSPSLHGNLVTPSGRMLDDPTSWLSILQLMWRQFVVSGFLGLMLIDLNIRLKRFLLIVNLNLHLSLIAHRLDLVLPCVGLRLYITDSCFETLHKPKVKLDLLDRRFSLHLLNILCLLGLLLFLLAFLSLHPELVIFERACPSTLPTFISDFFLIDHCDFRHV